MRRATRDHAGLRADSFAYCGGGDRWGQHSGVVVVLPFLVLWSALLVMPDENGG